MDQRGLGLVIYNLRQGVLKLGTTEKSIHLAVGKSCALSAQERQHTENRTATLSYMILHRVCGAFGMNCNGGRCFAFCVILLMRNAFCLSFQLPPRGPSNRLMGTCRWMGSHFQSWIDYNGFLFSLELLEWDSTFLGFGRSENSGKQGFKIGKIFTSLSLTNVRMTQF